MTKTQEFILKLINGNKETDFVDFKEYYYSNEKPTTTGKFWHYGENGEVVVW